MTEDAKSMEEQYNEARVMHKACDEKILILQEKPYLTDDEELEIRLLKKRKLHYKDIMEGLRGKLGK